MAVETTPKKEKTESKKPKITRPWLVILCNDDIHTFDEVILQLQKATGCSTLEGTRIAMEAHFKGKAVAYEGDFEDCNRVAGVLREIGLIVEIQG
ncbi:ATP-dependent Clp protease adaptor ClpS [candidate division KSB1 bacterium]|nr:ATP-dependent Clp protease adaptor ClpS [candidate division KSB1 bacterium]NIR68593.1 ATP-dependent Clp protease adaptor ClpS [candidate division KSB1 bacterium]NIS25430.1 ATP-dependent Clp protease adaptor ClpS [candidate division KSB1 bacterium]NIT72322.1 ATP-dependent Clp protease adaptor ClpS [candidate division KSB1 bacterium]NIU26106.1 ATP-dependent Clp protease adaptor ClpS [candidate division KSB1 bacterium]